MRDLNTLIKKGYLFIYLFNICLEKKKKSTYAFVPHRKQRIIIHKQTFPYSYMYYIQKAVFDD